jgi:hypothetical protein
LKRLMHGRYVLLLFIKENKVYKGITKSGQNEK